MSGNVIGGIGRTGPAGHRCGAMARRSGGGVSRAEPGAAR
ncbi:hypothetical protein KO481_37330 [Nocardia sp. NEAU-G5]|uniref:Uncharacterized protein n=1 Tax=Nocardia albiluteola TaxID=2842303 RepID=A0ABS6BBL3_9NOCA|nr:hypothetical protein [Nocardia albiluteola]